MVDIKRIRDGAFKALGLTEVNSGFDLEELCKPPKIYLHL